MDLTNIRQQMKITDMMIGIDCMTSEIIIVDIILAGEMIKKDELSEMIMTVHKVHIRFKKWILM